MIPRGNSGAFPLHSSRNISEKKRGRVRKANGNGEGRRVEERCRITLCSIQVNNIYPSAIGEHNGTSNKWVHAAWQDREILVEFYFAASFVIDYTPESPLRCVRPYSSVRIRSFPSSFVASAYGLRGARGQLVLGRYCY